MSAVAVHETRLAAGIGARHAVAFAYGRHALIGILRGLGLVAGDEVVLPPLTCKVVPLAILSLGLRPRWADVDERTLNLDPATIEPLASGRTRVVLFQHTYGSPEGLAGAVQQAARLGVPLIEDRAQCMPLAGALPAARGGVASIYSNNLLKPLPAGSGGAAVTDDDGLAVRIREFRDGLPGRSAVADLRLRVESWLHAHVLRPRLYWQLYGLQRRLGGGYRPQSRASEIEQQIRATARRPGERQSRRGDRWLAAADEVAAHRRGLCEFYARTLAGAAGLELPAPAGTDRPLYYFPVLTDHKPRVLERARRERVEIVPWPIRTPIYPVESERQLEVYGYTPGSRPRAERTARRLLGLPTHPGIDDEESRRVVELLTREAA